MDDYLQRLVTQVKQHSPRTRARQLALAKLFNEIQNSRDLYCPPRKELSPSIYRELYHETKQELWLFVCKNIESYDPRRGEVMTWVNSRFYYLFLQRVTNLRNSRNHPTFDPEQLIVPDDRDSLIERLYEVINEDREDLFKSKHIRDRPDVTFQLLVKLRLSGESWDDISGELGIRDTTLRSFYKRCSDSFKDKLKEYLEE